MKKQSGFTILELLFLILILFGAVGWTSNLVSFCETDFESPYKAEIIRGIGVPFFPVGMILGYMEIKDGE